MKRAGQQTQQQIADLVRACVGYWELRGIAREHITEMQCELEQHLQQAVSDGKSLEAVLGPHPAAFAESWAREMRPHVWRGSAVALHGLVYALSVVGTTALLSQLLAHSPALRSPYSRRICSSAAACSLCCSRWAASSLHASAPGLGEKRCSLPVSCWQCWSCAWLG